MQETNITSYSAPVGTLLTLGRPEGYESRDWLDYTTIGIGLDQIPDLIRMATDVALSQSDSEDVEVWSPIHARRALGQLHVEAAVEPLLAILDPLDGDDWVLEELPEVMGMIGPTALPSLTTFIADTTHLVYPRITAITSVEYIGKRWLDARTQSITILMHQLESFAENDEELNAFLILSLVHLQARETLPVIEQAFAADRVDTSILGDWDDVQVEFGLKTREDVDEIYARKLLERAAALSSDTPKKHQKASKKKAKNKMAKQSRKKNRK